MKRIFTVLLLVATILLGGCETIPVQQMSDARQAYRAAQEAGADKYVPELFNEVTVLMNDADHFLAEGRYGLAGKIAERARVLAIKARKKALTLRGATAIQR